LNYYSLPLKAGDSVDARVAEAMKGVYSEIKSTAREFNTRGDLAAGTNIASFLRIANVMLAHGSV
jgi:glutamate dehydrogenase (NADP+)